VKNLDRLIKPLQIVDIADVNAREVLRKIRSVSRHNHAFEPSLFEPRSPWPGDARRRDLHFLFTGAAFNPLRQR
jgi:hypothetical protein